MKDEYEKGVPLSTKLLSKDLFKQGKVVTDVLNYLQKKNFIIKVKEHEIHVKSALYQLHPSIELERVYQFNFDEYDSSLVIKLNRRTAAKKDQMGQQDILQNHFTLNQEGVFYLEKKYGELPNHRNDFEKPIDPVDINLLAYYYNDHFAVRPDIESRIYSTITQTKREHRLYIDFDGKPLIMTDISNSQVLLSIPVIIDEMIRLNCHDENNIPADFILYKELCESGKIYEYLLEKSKFKGSRSLFKKAFFCQIFFSRNSNRLPSIKKAFISAFPTAFKFITSIKKDNYKDFSIKLQRFEASIMIDSVFKQLNDEKLPAITLHDAIVVTNYSDLNYSENLIKSCLAKYNLKPHFKRDAIFSIQKTPIQNLIHLNYYTNACI